MNTKHPLRTIARLGWKPTLLAFTTALDGFIDTLFIAHLGLSVIQAVAIAGSILLIQLTMYDSFGSATRYFTSTAKDNKAEAWKIMIQGSFLSCLAGLALGGVIIALASMLFSLYGVTPEGVLYLQVVGGACVFPALFGVVSCGLQGLEKQNPTTKAGLAINISHVALDYVLIYPLHLGLMGAACATVLSSALGTGWIVVMFLRQAGTDIQWKLDWQLQKKILSMAFFQMLGNLSNQIGLVYYYAILARTGPEALAAVRILNVVERVVYATWMRGIIYTISPVVGPLIHRKKQVAIYIRWAMGTVIVGTFVSWAIQLILAHAVVGMFTDDPTVVNLAVWLILLYAWVNGLWYIYACVEEVFGVHKQIKTTAIINTLSSVLLVIGCWLASPTLMGVTYAEVVQYLVIGTVSVSYLCGYFKHAGITLFPFKNALKKTPVLDAEGAKDPVMRAFYAQGALQNLERLKHLYELPVGDNIRMVKQLLKDALAVIETDESLIELYCNRCRWIGFVWTHSEEAFESFAQRAELSAKMAWSKHLKEEIYLGVIGEFHSLPGVDLSEAYEEVKRRRAQEQHLEDLEYRRRTMVLGN